MLRAMEPWMRLLDKTGGLGPADGSWPDLIAADVPGPPDPALDPGEITAIAERYFRHYGHVARRLDDPDEFDWQSMTLTGWAFADPERLWPVVLGLVDRAPTMEALLFVAAGPLEDLVANHGLRLLDRLEERARVNDRFRDALRGVWGWERFPEEMRARLYPILDLDRDASEGRGAPYDRPE